jgi:hypothetical protein
MRFAVVDKEKRISVNVLVKDLLANALDIKPAPEINQTASAV